MADDEIKNEAIRQLLDLVFSLAGTVGALLLAQWFANPDSYRTFKMQAALSAKRTAQRRAEWWQRKADIAATIYNREKL